MSSQAPAPYFPQPPGHYDPRYFAQVMRAFSVFVQQTNNPGELRATSLTLASDGETTDRGNLTWNPDDGTVDITMGAGVIQQVGFETFVRAKNDTGSAIADGRVVGFAGVSGEILISEYVANAAANEIYLLGVTTRTMADQDIGPITLLGKVRGINTTGSIVGETWGEGDVLYASPSIAGALTKVRPTAPNVVIPVAAVLVADATAGEMLVRPVVPMSLDYGSFSSTADQTLASSNAATAITLNTTALSNGVALATSPGARLNITQSGFYSVAVSLQLASASSSAKSVYVWLRKNGLDVPNSTRAVTVNINGGFSPITIAYPLSLAAADYVEIYWAADSTDVTLDAVAASGFAPASPSVEVSVTQIQL